MGAEESSVKDGEIFNDLSELTRFEAEGGKGREGGKDPKNFLKEAYLINSGRFVHNLQKQNVAGGIVYF